MKRAASLVLSLSLGACGGSGGLSTAPAPPAEAVPLPASFRCVMGEVTALSNPSIRESVPWVARGPRGVQLVTQYHRFDGASESFGLFVDDGRDPVERGIGIGNVGTLAWTGATYLALVRDRLVRFDATISREVGPRATLPPQSCWASVTEGSGRAIAVWGRPMDNGCFEAAPWAQVFDAAGAPLGPAFALPGDAAAAVLIARWVRARWDFARFVVTAELAGDGVHSWVLDPDGAVLGTLPGAAACPRSGCVSVTAASERQAEQDDVTEHVLRVTSQRGASSFTTSVSAQEVRGLVVSGDRLLVLHDTAGRTGCGLAVLDVARRTTITQLRADAMTCAEGHARPTPRGFVVAEADPLRGPGLRAIDCSE